MRGPGECIGARAQVSPEGTARLQEQARPCCQDSGPQARPGAGPDQGKASREKRLSSPQPQGSPEEGSWESLASSRLCPPPHQRSWLDLQQGFQWGMKTQRTVLVAESGPQPPPSPFPQLLLRLQGGPYGSRPTPAILLAQRPCPGFPPLLSDPALAQPTHPAPQELCRCWRGLTMAVAGQEGNATLAQGPCGQSTRPVGAAVF